MRDWQVERRRHTRRLIEFGGLVVKSGVVELTGDDRAVIYGALLWMADELRGEQGEQARSLWTVMGTQTFEEQRPNEINIVKSEIV
ncbi:hypothetical protein FHS55_003390 [Angulomicrobium tetraedrale]|uniref:Conjugal transfer protein TraD n=1 Tax=Ancylobacter tetraedralis TaxID=217068 RepID=A0A839ZDE2_9HYPH|nr:conjugal transfer protein TraD [Ancylobacter tetraedralis]MBB3772769.1 hypothetical protein [Ancylobacter tetraedralis]